MDAAHIHLLLNHGPVVGTVFAILLLTWAALRRNPELTRAALGAFVLLALLGGVVYLTGEPAEEVVEGLPGVSEALIERHEEAALAATLALGVFGALALTVLVVYRRGFPRAVPLVMLALSFVPMALMGWTANLGGQIRHEEIRPASVLGAAAAGPEESTAPVRGERGDR